MSRHDTDAPTAPTVTSRITSWLRGALAYAVVAVGVAFLYGFFAVSVSAIPEFGIAELVPTIITPTEARQRYVNVTPLLVGLVVTSVGVWLR